MTVGSLCSGVGAADLAAETLGFGPLLWYAEIDRDASKVMAARFPGVPNLGDLKQVEWERLPQVDVLTAGYPCQSESYAGKRLGADPMPLIPTPTAWLGRRPSSSVGDPARRHNPNRSNELSDFLAALNEEPNQ